MNWKRGCESGHCVEVLFGDSEVKIRDSKNPDGPELTFDYEEWNAFVEGIIRGEFN